MNDKGLWAIALVMILAIGGMLYYDFTYTTATGKPIAEMSKSGGL